MMKKDITVAMVALGGYGNFYLKALFEQAAAHNVRLVAGIDPNPVGCRYLDTFQDVGIPIYPNLERFYAESSADLVMIAAPIHLHLPFTLTALAHGSSVLCEKPISGTIQEAIQMAEAAEQATNFVAIGYQWSYSESIQALKQDVIAGVLGKPVRLRTKVFWPRPASYFARNNWAAKLKGANGRWVLDSPAQNATAHYLHNCFYVLGAARESSAWPVDVQAELYRANDIENYDAAAIRCHTEDGTEILFYTAHPVPDNIGPILRYEFEHAVVEYEAWKGAMIAHFHDGQVKDYGDPFADDTSKLWQAADAVRLGHAPGEAPIACDVKAATPHVLCINGAQESGWDIVEFPEDLRCYRRNIEMDDSLTWITGLQQAFETCFDQGMLPSELGTLSWAKPGDMVPYFWTKTFKQSRFLFK